MQQPGGQVERGAVLDQQCFQIMQVQPLGSAGQSHHVDAVQGQIGVKIEVAGRVQQHRIAGA